MKLKFFKRHGYIVQFGKTKNDNLIATNMGLAPIYLKNWQITSL
jgi:hypothetical protein